MRPKERVLRLLAFAGPNGATGPQIGDVCGLWSGRLYIALMSLENAGTITSEWEDMPPPRHRRYKLCDLFCLRSAMSYYPHPMDFPEIKALVEAMWQLLDDMALHGTCVCVAAKAQARIAYEPFNDHEAEPAMTLEDARRIIAQCNY